MDFLNNFHLMIFTKELEHLYYCVGYSIHLVSNQTEEQAPVHKWDVSFLSVLQIKIIFPATYENTIIYCFLKCLL